MRTYSLAGHAAKLSILVLVTTLAPAIQAQTFKLLFTFNGGASGGGAWGTPLPYLGNLYATTNYGGSLNQGAVVSLNPSSGQATTLYSFAGEPTDGSYPMAGLAGDSSGNFYGTTTRGGTNLLGTIFQLSAGVETVLHNFTGPDGATPIGRLIRDSAGNLYGTTSQGGGSGYGVIFKADAFGGFTNLYSFGAGSRDGLNPAGNLLLVNGVLYGTTTNGGANYGTVFQFDLRTNRETVLYSFTGGPDGAYPVGGVVSDGKGNLYGTTSLGGNNFGSTGNGVVFRLNIASGHQTVIYTFAGLDGSQPMATLVRDKNGHLYGTTYTGGSAYINSFSAGYGTVFAVTGVNTLTTLYNFTNGTDGAYPYAGLTRDSSGNYYGATTRGGNNGDGTLFEITP